ncbi:MAG: peroxiredoxin [Betaproteobacteria bacterium]|jgi:peroxiredoxin (alkyl hydroperoxide reductase subunit C)|nr:peroxiredoxin [Betaproteobacteria bacterium]
MTIAIGQALPNVTLYEFIEEETPGCTVGPNAFQVSDMVKGKKIIIFGLPGAYTPTCSAKHVPSYVDHAAALKAKGIDEVWCVSVNDAFVMGSWGRELGTRGKVRMLGDGSAEFSKAVGLTLDLTARGMGLRSNRYAMLVDNGIVKAVHVEEPGKFEVSSAEAMLAKL